MQVLPAPHPIAARCLWHPPWRILPAVQGASVPFAMRSFSITGTDLSFSYTAPPGATYRLRRSQTMLPGSWTTVPGYGSLGSAAAAQSVIISDIINPAQPKDFFRLEQNP